jgi:DNA replication protein DnaC
MTEDDYLAYLDETKERSKIMDPYRDFVLDRLTHKCQVLSFSDDSYRLAHRKQIFDHN